MWGERRFVAPSGRDNARRLRVLPRWGKYVLPSPYPQGVALGYRVMARWAMSCGDAIGTTGVRFTTDL